MTLEGAKYKFPDPYPKKWVFVGSNGPIASISYDGSITLGDGYSPQSAAKEAADVFWATFARHVALHYFEELRTQGSSAGGGAGGHGIPSVSVGVGGGSAGNVMGAGGGGAAPNWPNAERYTVPEGMKTVSMLIGGRKVKIEIE